MEIHLIKERRWECIDTSGRLILPSCNGLLDCFNNQITHTSKYKSGQSLYYLEGEVNTILLVSLFSYIYQNQQSISTSIATTTWSIKTSWFKQYIGYKEGGKSKDLYSQLAKLSTLKYYYNDIKKGQAVSISFNDTKTIMTVKSKYFKELLTAMKAVSGVYNRHGHKVATGLSTYSSMVNTSILKERNIGAVEIVFELCKLIERRGPLHEDKFAHLSMLTLLKRCPTLHTRIMNNCTKEGNRVFRESLKKAFELLEMYTLIYDCFEDLHFEVPNNVTPTRDCELKIYYKKRIK